MLQWEPRALPARRDVTRHENDDCDERHRCCKRHRIGWGHMPQLTGKEPFGCEAGEGSDGAAAGKLRKPKRPENSRFMVARSDLGSPPRLLVPPRLDAELKR